MTDSVNLIAIVVAQEESGSICYASVKYQYDMRITQNSSKKLRIGSWIMVNVPKVFAASHTVPLQYQTSEYTVILSIYTTKVDNGIVEIEFPYFLGEQNEVENEVIGVVKRSNNTTMKQGKWMIHVENFLDPFEPFRKTQWLLKELSECLPPEFSVIGIVCGTMKDPRLKYVWCNRRKVGEDVVLLTKDDDVLPNGTWLQMTWKSENDFKIKERPLKYTRMEAVYTTTGSASTIGMVLEGRVEGSAVVTDLFHPFVGLILNQQYNTPSSGVYKLDIVRGRKNTGKDGVTESVWYLKKATPIGKHATSIPPTPIREELKYKRIESPPTYESAALQNHQIPMKSAQRAVITGIQYSNSEETKFFIWNFDEKKAGLLTVPPHQSQFYKMGTFFTVTDFKENHLYPGNLNSNGENLQIVENLYETRIERKPTVNILQFKVKCQMKNGDVTVEHEHFGDIVDNMGRLKGGASELQMWIKRMNLKGRQCWVVVQTI